eukprot:CAMPEP_0201489598 /NCGR_PEP_ID=MMETSP0151_2-20130828/22899_1 /ASSEMBLY_ACC=CAM_ASM_000257 /TAXON_ID=200890 /ORGANISM="Paramoeba atlantica, Strain 621/1 / CCAP 1560/9" /LENGTH=200 /DNA_ID=CAMNT_0047875235 /DNA_START=53 /DNA_END=655 /DNA_ORIENTATION=+
MNLQSFPPLSLTTYVQYLEQKLFGLIGDVVETSPRTTRFHSPEAITPESLTRALTHLVKYSPSTSECFVVGLIYLDRLKRLHGAGFVNPHTIGQLFFLAVMIASKYYDDVCFDNDSYSKILMIKKPKLMKMEMEFLLKIGFDCSFSSGEFDRYSRGLPNATNVVSIDTYSISKRAYDLLYASGDSQFFTKSSRKSSSNHH